MIRSDLDPWTDPLLFAFYEDEFDEAFLRRLRALLADWDAVDHVTETEAIIEAVSEGGRAELAAGFDGMDVSLRAISLAESSRDLASLTVRDFAPAEHDGVRFFEFVVGLYRRSLEAGRRPAYTVVSRDSGRTVVPPFTEQTIRAGAVCELAWIHVLTPAQVASLDRERVLSAPATRVEELADGSVTLALTLGSDDERERVAEHLGIDPPVGASLFDDLEHELDYVRHRAARRLEYRARRGTVSTPALLDSLDAADDHVRFVLTRALRHVDGDDVDAVLRRLARSDESESVRSSAARAVDCEAVKRDERCEE